MINNDDLNRDITAPVSLALSHLELIEAQSGDELAGSIQEVRRNILRMYRMMYNAQDFERLRAGALVIRRRACTVSALLQRIYEEAQPTAQRLGIALIGDMPPSLRAECDESAVERVVWNLLTNALAATASGGRVMLGAVRENDTVRIEVRDTGTGIDEAVLGRVMNSELFEATGLGIARVLLRLHGSELTLENTADGTRAAFTLPGIDAQQLRSGSPELPVRRGIPLAQSEAAVLPGA